MKLTLQSFIVSLLGLLSATVVAAQQTPPKSNWLTHTDSVYNFSFKYPLGWDLKLPGTGTRFFVTSQKETEDDKFRENINCLVRVMESKAFKVSDAGDMIKQNLAEKLENFKLIKSPYLTWNNSETLELEYTCTQRAGDETYDLHLLQYISVVDGKLFTLTYTASQASYDKYLDMVKTIFNSLQIK